MKIPLLNQFYNHSKERSLSFILLIALIIITVAVTYLKIKVQISIGPQWDAFDFLADAAYFAGQGFGYVDFIRPPLLSFLTSIFFRLGYTSEVSIFAVDGSLFVFGVIGLYLFLKLRFNSIMSFLGALIFISFPVVLLWVGAGYTDVASTSFSIWALYLTVLAVRKNPNFFCLSFPIATLAFLTRFPAAIIIFPMILYILINREKLKNFRTIFIGIFLSFLIMIPVFMFFWNTLGNPLAPFLQMFSGTVSTSSSAVRFAYNPDPFFYVTNSLYSLINMDFLNSSSWGIKITFFIAEILILYSVLMGLVIYIHKILKLLNIKLNLKKILEFKTSKILKISAIIVLFLIFIGTLGKISYLLSDIIFLILCFMFYPLLRHENLNYIDIDFLFLSLLVSYLIFDSFYPIKVCRYFIPMAPAFAYFIILGLSQFSTKLKFKIKNINITSVLSVLLALSLLFSTGSYLYQLENDPMAHGLNFKIQPTDKWFNMGITSKAFTGELYSENYNTKELKNVAEWLKINDPDYKNQLICSDYFWPQLNWYSKTNIKGLSIQDEKYIDTQLKNQSVDYYINMGSDGKLENYIEVAEFKTNFAPVVIYKKNY
ncbi:glycosyltransferase family 39 protein [Methanobacterium sp.]|uniref:glycosyltransferase family 39 protein n=1 Tax=Methanobacterium sp. TaxID=2164 RepID=UPI003C795B8E